MRVLMTGGGTGGHVTPLKYVAQALKLQAATTSVAYIGPRRDQFTSIMKDETAVDEVYGIWPAKYRRYNEPMLKRLFDMKTNLLNLRDFFLFWLGLVQAIWLVGRNTPDVMLSKGGAVSIQVALAARLFKVPIITHDSDTLPARSNRVIAKWAVKNAVGQPIEFYDYDTNKLAYTGIPLPLNIQQLVELGRDGARQMLNIDREEQLVVVSGGSLGATSINNVLLKIAHGMSEAGVSFGHFTGREHYEEIAARTADFKRYQTFDFMPPEQYQLWFVAADVVVTRAGATATAELAALSKATIIIPASQLEDQLKNAIYLKQHNASVILTDEDILARPDLVEHAVFEYLENDLFANAYGQRLNALVRSDGAQAMAQLLTEVVGQ